MARDEKAVMALLRAFGKAFNAGDPRREDRGEG